MTGLALQQRAFRRAVVEDDAADGLFAAGTSDPLRRLQIYRHAYRSRLTDALAANYPVLARALGDAAFAELAVQYIEARPSHKPSIRWFGDALGDFVGEHDDVLPHPALGDLLRLEWAICCAFDAADAPLATREDFAQLAPDAWPALRLKLHPSASLLDLAWRVEPTWQALSRDAEAGVEQAQPEPVEDAHAIVVWREGLTPKWRSVDAAEAETLRALQRGELIRGTVRHRGATNRRGARARLRGRLAAALASRRTDRTRLKAGLPAGIPLAAINRVAARRCPACESRSCRAGGRRSSAPA